MFNYPELFVTKWWWYSPVLTPAGEEMLAQRFVAYRLYDGITVKLKGKKWFFLYESDWLPVKPSLFTKNKVKFSHESELQEALTVNQINWPDILKHAWYPATYELVHFNGEWRLIDHSFFDQVSEINMYEMRDLTPVELYGYLQREIKHMQIDGVLLRTFMGNKFVAVKAEGFEI